MVDLACMRFGRVQHSCLSTITNGKIPRICVNVERRGGPSAQDTARIMSLSPSQLFLVFPFGWKSLRCCPVFSFFFFFTVNHSCCSNTKHVAGIRQFSKFLQLLGVIIWHLQQQQNGNNNTIITGRGITDTNFYIMSFTSFSTLSSCVLLVLFMNCHAIIWYSPLQKSLGFHLNLIFVEVYFLHASVPVL